MKTHHIRLIKRFSWALFILYLILMAYFLFFSEYLNRSSMGTAYRYNLTLFQEVKRSFWCLQNGIYSYFWLNFIMNIIAFVPLGFFLPLLSKTITGRKFWYVILSALQFTLVIEFMQLVLKVGTFDVDDIILNTIGGIIGYVLFLLARTVQKILRKVLET